MNKAYILVLLCLIATSSFATNILLNASTRNAYETENTPILFNVTGVGGNITSYNLSITFNNTLILNSTNNVVNANVISFSQNISLPLVDSNLTNITYNITFIGDIGGTYYTNSTLKNQTILLYYTMNAMPVTQLNGTVTENALWASVAFPSKPTNATSNISYSYSYYCSNSTKLGYNYSSTVTKTFNDATYDNWLGCTSVVPVNISLFYVPSTHIQETISSSGYDWKIVNATVGTNRSYTLTFNGSPESNSTKTITQTNVIVGVDEYTWLVPTTQYFTASGIDLDILTPTITDELNGSAVTVTNYGATFSIKADDGYFKNFSFSNASAMTLWGAKKSLNTNTMIYTLPGGEQTFGATGYQPRQRIYVQRFDFTERLYENITLAETTASGYTWVQVTVYGYPTASFIKVYQSNGASYVELDDKYLDSNKMISIWISYSGTYQIEVYDSDGNLLVTQSSMIPTMATSPPRLDVGKSTPFASMDGLANLKPECWINGYGGNDYSNVTTPFVICQVGNNIYNRTIYLENKVNGTVNCTTYSNYTSPGSYNVIGLNGSIIYTFTLSKSYSTVLSCHMEANKDNIYTLYTYYGSSLNNSPVKYIIYSGAFNIYGNEHYPIRFNLDFAIWIFFILAVAVLFLWNNMIIAGLILLIGGVAGFLFGLLPLIIAIFAFGFGGAIFVGGIIMKRRT